MITDYVVRHRPLGCCIWPIPHLVWLLRPILSLYPQTPTPQIILNYLRRGGPDDLTDAFVRLGGEQGWVYTLGLCAKPFSWRNLCPDIQLHHRGNHFYEPDLRRSEPISCRLPTARRFRGICVWPTVVNTRLSRESNLCQYSCAYKCVNPYHISNCSAQEILCGPL